MVYTPEGFTYNSTIYPRTSSPLKKPSDIKSLCMFTNVLDVNKKTAYRRFGGAKYKRKALKFGNTPWALKKIEKGTQKSVKR